MNKLLVISIIGFTLGCAEKSITPVIDNKEAADTVSVLQPPEVAEVLELPPEMITPFVICSGGGSNRRTCREGFIRCQRSITRECINLNTDKDNCGRCGNVCIGGHVCSKGMCVCPPDTMLCDNQCIDTPNNQPPLCPNQVLVTPLGDGNEVITPDTPQILTSGNTLSFTVTPNSGYTLSQTVGGTCPQGSWNGNTYTTEVITTSCNLIFTAVATIFAYVTPQLAATSIDQFLLDIDGSLLSYTTAYTAVDPGRFGQMTFATVNGVQYAYILDLNGAVYWCTINSNGSFSNCTATSSLPPLGSWQARGIAFATFNAQYAYVVDPGNNVVYQCALDLTGNFSNCQQPPSPYSLPTLAPYGIAFATSVNGAQQAYIADAGSGSIGDFGDVLLCSTQNDGSFDTCIQTPAVGAPNWIPAGIAFTTVNGIQYAYVADNGAGVPGHVYRCTLNNDGTFVDSGCTQTPANDSSLTDWYPYYIAFQEIAGTKYAYVVNSSGSIIGNIYRCLVDNNGLLTNCILTPITPPSPWQPSGIAFR